MRYYAKNVIAGRNEDLHALTRPEYRDWRAIDEKLRSGACSEQTCVANDDKLRSFRRRLREPVKAC